jgi:hypothetical protein
MKLSDFSNILLKHTSAGEEGLLKQGLWKILKDKVEEEALDTIALLANEWLDLRATGNNNCAVTPREFRTNFSRQAAVKTACQLLAIRFKQISAEAKRKGMEISGGVDETAFGWGWATIRIEIYDQWRDNSPREFSDATLTYVFNMESNTNRITGSKSVRKAHIGPQRGLFEPGFTLTAPVARENPSTASGNFTMSKMDDIEALYSNTLLLPSNSDVGKPSGNSSYLHTDWGFTASFTPLPQSRPASAQSHHSGGFEYAVGSVRQGGQSRTSSFGSQASGRQSPSGLSDTFTNFSFNNYNPDV